MQHTPVLAKETIKFLTPQPNQNFIDAAPRQFFDIYGSQFITFIVLAD